MLDEVEKRAHKNINLYSIIVISRVINPNRLNAVRVSFDGY